MMPNANKPTIGKTNQDKLRLLVPNGGFALGTPTGTPPSGEFASSIGFASILPDASSLIFGDTFIGIVAEDRGSLSDMLLSISVPAAPTGVGIVSPKSLFPGISPCLEKDPLNPGSTGIGVVSSKPERTQQLECQCYSNLPLEYYLYRLLSLRWHQDSAVWVVYFKIFFFHAEHYTAGRSLLNKAAFLATFHLYVPSQRYNFLMTDFHYYCPIDVRYGDLDPQGHVNNARFLTYFEQAELATLSI